MKEEPVLDSLAPMRAEMQKRKEAEEEALKKESDKLTSSMLVEEPKLSLSSLGSSTNIERI